MTSWPRKFVLALLRLYKFAISPWLGNACRYLPTCSEYASQAIETHGLARGTVLAVSRLLRCHPFASGGYDPVSHMDRRGSDDFAAAHTD
ncbi:MAG: membrane protein insertion efficiency factor YidD [Acidobacteria bacterium]|nr:MAG: membrane protein insertion efficiency factor YidD [Acidobacteriota bacterium]